MLSEPTEGLTSEQTGKPDTSVTETVKITTSNTTATLATSAESGSIPWTVIIIFLVLLLIAVFICCSLKMRKKLEDESKDLEKQDLGTDGGSSITEGDTPEDGEEKEEREKGEGKESGEDNAEG